jgi:hypothetical protein
MKLIARLSLSMLIGIMAAPCDDVTPRTAASDGRLFFLDAKGRLLTANTDGTDLKVMLSAGMSGPDGVAADVAGKHIFWTNMGKVKEDDGSIQRLDLDGRNLTTVVPAGGTFTAKQLKLDARSGKLYWSDREGMRIMRANLDGSRIETLVETGHGEEASRDARNWCVGIGVDTERGEVYWTQKGGSNAGLGSIRRANLEIPRGQNAANRSDIEVLIDGLPEPIDLDLDPNRRMMYWTDRGDPPAGNTVNRASMDNAQGHQTILVSGLHEGIGISLDLRGGRMFFTDLGGNVYRANLDGSDKRTILTGQGALTGIVYVELTR